MKKMLLLLAVVFALAALPATAEMTREPAPQSIELAQAEACSASLEEIARPQSIQAASCPDRARIYYYSDASHTTQVGTCWHACCQLWTCTGQLSDFYTVFKFPCDFN